MNPAGITLDDAIRKVQDLRTKFVALGIKLDSQRHIPNPGDVTEYYTLKQESVTLRQSLQAIYDTEVRLRTVFEFLDYEIQDVGRYIPAAPMPAPLPLMVAPAAGGSRKRRASRKTKKSKKAKKSKKTRRTKH
jgi:hypothetical protein